MRRTDKVVTGIVVVAILAILVALALGYRDCRSRGGQYVRGLFWMECVRR